MMSIKPILLLLMLAVSARAQDAKLATAKAVKCTFPLNAVSTWKAGKAEAEVKPAKLVLEFTSINTDEGTAQLEGGSGKYDIIVRYANGYLSFVQSYADGPLYTTTVFQKEASKGKLKAVHSRHELFDFPLPGFTSSPEQYYGECEITQ
jgi:hypothetical protein